MAQAEIDELAAGARGELVAHGDGDHRFAGPRERSEARRDVDAVAVECHVVGQDVGRMNPNTQQHAISDGDTFGQLGRAAMQRSRTLDGVARVCEGNHETIAQPLQQVALVPGNRFVRRLEEQVTNTPRSGQFVPLHQPDRFDDVREEDGPGGVMQQVGGRLAALRHIACSAHCGYIPANLREAPDNAHFPLFWRFVFEIFGAEYHAVGGRSRRLAAACRNEAITASRRGLCTPRVRKRTPAP